MFYRVTGYVLWLLFLGKKSPDLFFLIWCVLQGYRICLLAPIFHHANLHKQTTKKFSKIHYIIRQKNQTWYLLGSKSHWIIGQKRQNVAQYRCVLIKKTTLSNVTPFGIKITIDNWSKKSKIARYFRHVLSKIATIRGEGWAFVAPFGIKITIDYQPKKNRKNTQYDRRVLRTKIDFRWEVGGWACMTPFGIKITIGYRPKKSKIC